MALLLYRLRSKKGDRSVRTGLDVDTHLAIMAISAHAVLEMDTIAQSIKRADPTFFLLHRYIGQCMRESLVPPMLFSKLSRGSVQRELSLDIRSQNHFLDHFHQKVIIISRHDCFHIITKQSSIPKLRLFQVHQDKALYSDIIRTKIHLASTPGLSCLNGSVIIQNLSTLPV